jgi:hypothetical protein
MEKKLDHESPGAFLENLIIRGTSWWFCVHSQIVVFASLLSVDFELVVAVSSSWNVVAIFRSSTFWATVQWCVQQLTVGLKTLR